ncbi:MAG: flagellar motor switch protein FliM [Candidatus Cloacimonetes bacterium]|nr:flagellar motor switch protein FliM [Candidatus Cloacimonadota bacterium]
MSKLLTQEEIDALLSQESGPDSSSGLMPDLKELRLYDFRRPDRVNKDQVKKLRTIHEIFTRLISPYLSSTLRTIVDVKSPVIDQVTYLEFTMSASDETNMYIFEIDKLDGQALLDIDPDFTHFIIDRLFGGTGVTLTRRAESGITVIESSVLRTIADKIMEHYKEAWAQIDELEPKIVGFETNPQLVTIAPSSETMIVMNFPVVARNFEFTILLCFPYFMLEPLLKKMLSETYMTMLRRNTTKEDVRNLEHAMKQTSLSCDIELGRAEITVEEFLGLNEGDIILLTQQIDKPLTTNIAGLPKFLGVPGQHRKKLALQIRHTLDKEGEIINE